MDKEEVKENAELVGKKRGRKPKGVKEVFIFNKDRTKFFVDLSKDKKILKEIMNLLEQANNKSYGKEISFKDLSIYAVKKLNSKDIEKIQESSLSEMEKVERALDDYNSKNGESLSLGEYLVKQLKI
jgi:hypothetical protein